MERLVRPYAPPPGKSKPERPDPEQATKALTQAVKKIETAKKKRDPIDIGGRVPIDDQFNATITFSPAYGTDAGRTYGAALGITPGAGSPEGNKEFYIRCSIEQHRVDPLLQGFQTVWDPPPGWRAVDGLGATLYDEAINNPVAITRLYLSPAEPDAEIGFLVVIAVKYQP